MIAVLVIAHASAARADDPLRSPTEPGALGMGHAGGTMGVAQGGPFGIGGELVAGLGRVDLLAGVSFLPPFCIAFGCSPADYFAHTGAQVAIAESADGRSRLGLRATVDVQTTGWQAFHTASVSLVASTGSTSRRLVGEAIALEYHQADFPEDEGWYLGPAIGYERLGRHFGYQLVVGWGEPLDRQERGGMPLLSAEVLVR